MKKLLILTVIALLTLSSFTTKNKAKERDVVYFRYVVYFHCNDGHASGSFHTSSSDPAEWQRIANALCNM